MDFNSLHFAYPLWLWGVAIIPLVWILFFIFYQTHNPSHQLEKFVDAHLLPYLLGNTPDKKSSFWKTLLLWSVVWSCLTLALAGPRWNFREIETFSRDQSLVILLDLSESMNATDVKPSRLVRAKQKIEDFINVSKGVKIGLIAFAADPHMITPITEDKETIRHLLPSLDTDLVYVQGSKLSSAFEMASKMLEAERGDNKALLLISDGGFEDSSAIIAAKKLANKGVVIYSMGVGSVEGALLQDHQGNVIKKGGVPIVSKLEKERLSEISKVGNGRYLEAHYSDHDERLVLNDLEKHAKAQIEEGKKNRFWEEHFYLLILPTLPILLWWFRRGHLFALLLIFFAPVFGLEAATASDYFKNSEELGKQALDEGDYETAIRTFQDPYRKGVSCYKAGNFEEAEKMFRQSSRPEVASDAAYNLGNALVQQQKLKESIAVYEDLLKNWPDHANGKENLALVKKMMEQQKQDPSNEEDSDQTQEQSEEQSESESKSQNGEKNESKDSNGSNDKSNDKKQNQKNEQRKGSDDSNALKEEQNEGQEEPEAEAEGDEKEGEENAGTDESAEVKAEPETSQGQEQVSKAPKSQEDQDADLWLNRIENNPKMFLKNKFYFESKRNGTTSGGDPW